jgi:hypothetical protein
VSVTFSVPTLDQRIWRTTEPNTAPPRKRLAAVRKLVDAGIKAGVGMAPLLPGLSDKPELMADVVRAARDAGATHLWANVLYLRPGTREHFMDHLARDWPELVPAYERLYAGRAYLPEALVKPARDRARGLGRELGIGDRRLVRLDPPMLGDSATKRPTRGRTRDEGRDDAEDAAGPEAEQLSLILAAEVRAGMAA